MTCACTNDETYIAGLDLDPSDKLTTFPVKEADTALSFDTEEHTSSQAFSLEAHVQTTGAALFEVAEELNTCG